MASSRDRPEAPAAVRAPRSLELAAALDEARALAAAGEPYELEVRTRVPAAAAAAALARLAAGGPPTVTRSIALVAPGGARRERFFEVGPDGAPARRDEYTVKERLFATDADGLRVAVARETPVPAGRFVAAGAAARVKLRRSWGPPAAPPGWRLDATTVLELAPAAVGAALPAAARALQAGEVAGDLELECEWVGPGPPDAAGLAAAVAAVAEAAEPGAAAFAAGRAAAATALAAIGVDAYPRSLKPHLPQVAALSREVWRDLYGERESRPLFVTPKADGERALLVVREGRATAVTQSLRVVEWPPPKTGGGRAALLAQATVLDGELLDAGAPAFAAFDALYVAGESFMLRPLADRLAALARGAAEAARAGAAAFAKPFEPLADTPEARRAQVARLLRGPAAPVASAPVEPVEPVEPAPEPAKGKGKAKGGARKAKGGAPAAPAAPAEKGGPTEKGGPAPYGRDGLVYARDADGAAGYRATEWYKYKPLAETTCDFLVAEVGGALELHVGVSAEAHAAMRLASPAGRGRYFATRFAPSLAPDAWRAPLDAAAVGGPAAAAGRICECLPLFDDDSALVGWRATRVRADRAGPAAGDFGNDFRIAELTLLNHFAPLDEEQLASGPAGAYFGAEKSPAYRAQTGVVSLAKSAAARWMGARRVADLAAGRGADLGRWLDAGAELVAAVDGDREALTTLARRYHTLVAPRDRRGPRARLVAAVADLRAPAADTLALLARALGRDPAGAFDGVACNLAVHYFADSLAGLANFAALAAALAAPGGRLALTALDGAAVHALINDPRSPATRRAASWEGREPGAEGPPKFELVARYAPGTPFGTGLAVGVRLPFSRGELYDEFLVDVAALTAALVAAGFGGVRVRRLDSYADEFEATNRARLTDLDRRYLGLMFVLTATK